MKGPGPEPANAVLRLGGQDRAVGVEDQPFDAGGMLDRRASLAVPAMIRCPDDHRTRGAHRRGGDLASLRVDRQVGYRTDPAGKFQLFRLLGREIPEVDGPHVSLDAKQACIRGDDEPLVLIEELRGEPERRASPGAGRFPVLAVAAEEPHLPVGPGREQVLAIAGAEGHAQGRGSHRPWFGLDDLEFSSARGVPDPDRAVEACGRHLLAVGAESRVGQGGAGLRVLEAADRGINWPGCAQVRDLPEAGDAIGPGCQGLISALLAGAELDVAKRRVVAMERRLGLVFGCRAVAGEHEARRLDIAGRPDACGAVAAGSSHQEPATGTGPH